ncbi:ATP-binding protein [Chromobacterium sp. ATCC 53434]|uniref:ATP-binding protein n=1 Tax=Chromobacterium sp. (strain ATCC 53434 / SC 14030) TaxID=2059672 RepID=UPI0013051753|nr:ATP-binding protein [Chromobacterium sp. ATCC 53434]
MQSIKKIMLFFCMTASMASAFMAHAEVAPCHQAVVGILKSCNRPFCTIGSNGIPVGLDMDVLNEALLGSDVSIQFKIYPTLQELRAAFASGEINVITHVASHMTSSKAWLSSPYAYQRIDLVSKEKYKGLIDFVNSGNEIGVSGSPFLMDYFTKFFPKARLKYFESVLQGEQAVASGKLVALITFESMAQSARDDLLSRHGELYIHSLLVPDLLGERYSIPIRFAVEPRCTRLQNTVQHGLDMISAARLTEIQSRWLTEDRKSGGLSSIDRQWLQQHGPIRVGLKSEPLPYDRIDAQGKWVGVGASLLKPFFDSLKIPYEIILLPPNIDSVHAMYASDLDVVVATPYQPQLFGGGIINIPYDTISWGLVRSTRNASSNVVAAQLNHFKSVRYHDFPAAKKILAMDSIEQSLQAVVSGKADAAAVSVEAVSNDLLSTYAGKLYLDRHVKGEEKLVLIISPSAKALAGALNHYISSQPADFMDRLHKYQHLIYVKQGYELGDILLYLSGPVFLTAIVVLFLLWINYRVAGFRDKAKRDAVQAMRQYTLAELESRNKTDFLATIGHEVRTPMTGVLGALNLLKHSVLTSEQDRQLDIATRSTELLQDKLNELLDFSKLESGTMVLNVGLINLARVVDRAVVLFCAEGKKKQLSLFSLSEPAKNYFCYGDEACIMQMVSNLVSNAIKFTAEGEVVVITSMLAAGRFKIVVTDTGRGMTEAFQTRLFTFYSQENPESGSGLGLGLAITKKLVSKMGGSIEVSSQPGMGTRFSVELQLPSATSNEDCIEKPFLSMSGKRVWLDIQHEVLRDYVQRWLRHFQAEIMMSPPADVAVSDVSDIVIMGKRATLIPKSEFNCTRLVEAIACSIGMLDKKPVSSGSEAFKQAGTGRTLLLIDDDDICREIIREQLNLIGFTVVAVANGKAAISAWRTECFDLTLMDLRLTDMSGYQLAQQIREVDTWLRHPSPFWILSACSEINERERYVAEGFAGFVQKPCTAEKLADLLGIEVDKRR